MAATPPRQEMPDATFEEWDRRIEHRYNGLAHIYGSPDYAMCWRYGAAGCRRCLVGTLQGWNHQRCKTVQVAGCRLRLQACAGSSRWELSGIGCRLQDAWICNRLFFLQVLEDIDPQVVSAWWALCWVQTLLPECRKEVGKGL